MSACAIALTFTKLAQELYRSLEHKRTKSEQGILILLSLLISGDVSLKPLNIEQ